jgi:flagella basal body P-ring formation protein FlgA
VTKSYSPNRTNVLLFQRVSLRRRIMSLLRTALKKERWDLAAHVIVLAAARALSRGGRLDGKDCKEKKRRAER